MKATFLKFIGIFILLTLNLICNAQNKIRFGVTYFYQHFVFSSESVYIHGLDIDIARAVCQRLNAQCTFTPMSLNDAFNNLRQNKVDAIMGAISITPERKAAFELSIPYLKDKMSYIVLSTSQLDLQHLLGKRVGVVKSSTFYHYLTNKYSGKVKVITYDTNEQLATALSSRQIDAMLIDTPAAYFWVGYSTGLFKTIGTPEYLPSDQGYGIVVKKGNVSLINSINHALNDIMKNGTYNKIKQAYSVYFSVKPPIQQPRS
jgi:ABC-type amino acid transport substrate-binding protein